MDKVAGLSACCFLKRSANARGHNAGELLNLAEIVKKLDDASVVWPNRPFSRCLPNLLHRFRGIQASKSFLSSS